ncbi:hypothetical protein CC86DRAFT_429685 [Ophiobolus disseminans]|uniref:Uncharacterized protein n=1 Tax=Ophiobolus disseminans TaxID=1469910 RepID=A0A6A6ZG94_9PLEO|nr:hypothetical protein CC86DRAFT_429685 [Ophiobolus disseminans]
MNVNCNMSSVLGVDAQPGVFLGVWINWSRGWILGSTLTSTQRNGALLVAFVALFITFVGSRLWRILCFTIHHTQSTAGPHDGIYHQQQAILKNADNATAGLISWYQLLKAWRKVGHRPFWRVLPVALLTLVMAVGFIAASLVSSRITSAMGQEVLVRGACGVNILGHYIAGQDKNPAVETSPEFFTVLLPFLVQRLVSFSNYALSCYSEKGNTKGCNTFVKNQLPFTTNRNAPCPFEQDICRSMEGNLFIDTGYLDSHTDFGMNARPEERFLYRRTTHCAPLVTNGYTSSVNFSTSGIATPHVQYLYGATLGANPKSGNATYIYPQSSAKDKFQSGRASLIPEYTLGYNYVNVINGTNAPNRGFTPIPTLQRTDADVTLFFLSSNQVASPVPINDPWYSAHQTIPGYRLNFTGWGNLSVGAYFADQPASVLGCAKQYQICYPGTPPRCSRLGGKQELWWLLTSLAQTEQQLNSTKWAIMSALTGNELDAFVQTLGAASLSSKASLVTGVQGPLPDHQWQLDIEHWHAATLVAMQGSAVDAAMGPSAESMKKFWPGPENGPERRRCGNQKILSDAHSNFSIFGLAFTFVVGGLIIIASFVLESPPGFVRRYYRDKHVYSRLEWCANGTLQLQRLAHEELGLGHWSACTQDVPITRKGEMLGLLYFRDPEHPVLMQQEGEASGCSAARDDKSTAKEAEDTRSDDAKRKSEDRIVDGVRRMETGLSSASTVV